MSVSVLSNSEVQDLIRDLDLVPSSCPEAQAAYQWRFAVVHRFYQLRSYYRSILSISDFDCSIPLDIMYHRFNSKGKKRSFGSSFDLQLKIDF